MRCARVGETGVVEEILAPRDTLTDKFHPDFIAGLVDIPDHVQLNWVFHGGDWHSERPAPQPTAEDFANAIQAHTDATAQSRGYADGVALAGYALSTVPAWASEAQAFVAWRDHAWVFAYTELAKVQSGQRSVPTITELLAELPPINW